jgi:WD40 repeat protein
MVRLVHNFGKPSFSLTMSPDRKWIAQNKSSRINLFDAATYEQVASFNDVQYISKEAFSSDSKYLLAKSTDCKLALYDLNSMELVHKHRIKKINQPQDQAICFSSDNKKIIDLVYNNDLLGYIAVWDIGTWHETRYYEGENNVFQTIVFLDSNEKCLVSGHHRDNSGVYNIPFYLFFDISRGTGEFVDAKLDVGTTFMFAEKLDILFAYHKINASITFLHKKKVVQLAKNGCIQSIALSNDNTKIAIMFDKLTVVYDFPSMEIIAEIDVTIGSGRSGRISFSPDGQMVLLGTWENGFLYSLN